MPYNTCRFRNNMTLKIPNIFLVNLWKYTKINFHQSIEACMYTEKRLRAQHIADARMRSRDLIQVHSATDADKIGTWAGTAYSACNREYDQRNIECTDTTSKQNPDLTYTINRSPKITNTWTYRHFNEERGLFVQPSYSAWLIINCCRHTFIYTMNSKKTRYDEDLNK